MLHMCIDIASYITCILSYSYNIIIMLLCRASINGASNNLVIVDRKKLDSFVTSQDTFSTL